MKINLISNLEILLLYTLYKKTIDAMVVGFLQGGHKCSEQVYFADHNIAK